MEDVYRNNSEYECKMREAEVQSLYSSEVHGMCEIELAYRKSQVE